MSEKKIATLTFDIFDNQMERLRLLSSIEDVEVAFIKIRDKLVKTSMQKDFIGCKELQDVVFSDSVVNTTYFETVEAIRDFIIEVLMEHNINY